jgi:hypothetical protein
LDWLAVHPEMTAIPVPDAIVPARHTDLGVLGRIVGAHPQSFDSRRFVSPAVFVAHNHTDTNQKDSAVLGPDISEVCPIVWLGPMQCGDDDQAQPLTESL